MSLLVNSFFNTIPNQFQGLITAQTSVLAELKNISATIKMFFRQLKLNSNTHGLTATNIGYYFEHTLNIIEPFVDLELNIYIGKNTTIEPSSIIKKNTVILNNCELRSACYLRGDLLIGNNCVLGHCSEFKESILFDYVACGHFNYVGNSFIGNYVNLGAGAKLANLEFRTLAAKKNDLFNSIKLPKLVENLHISHLIMNKKMPEELDFTKLGSILGDGVEIGCNAVLAPACIIGQETCIHPNYFLKKGYYPAHSTIK